MKTIKRLAPDVLLLGGTGCVLAGVYLLFGLAVTLLVAGVAMIALSIWATH